nr:aspartate aminotransferase family protein [Lachnospiraceae bacterium]
MITKFKTNAEVIENGDKYLYGNHIRMPLALEGGDGAWVFDKDGNKYLDFVGGIAVNGLGHNHPRIQECLAERAKTILHCSNYFYNEPAVQTAKLIVENSCFDKVLFANSGAEANEGQIKLARKYAKDHGHPERFVVITMKNSFHGRTLATCTATGQYGVHRYFEPLPDGFRYATFNDLDSVKALVDEYTCAILTEPVQGEGGVRPATPEFLKGLRELCDEKGILLMFDEVQVGSGRTGKLFAHQYYGVEPDTCSMAKALGSGVPIAALCARGEACNVLTPGTHGSTFAGGPLACALAMTTLDVMLNEGVLNNCAEVGEYFRKRAHEVIEKNHPDTVDEIRGLGLINGIQLKKPSGQPVVDLCFKDNNVLINNTNGNVLRFIPPLIVTKEEVDIVINAVDAAMTKLGW